jgi:predicted DNA-binding protein
MGDKPVTNHRDGQVVRDAQATIAATEIQQALAEGAMTFTDYPPAEAATVLAGLPPAEELDVPTSVRLPAELHRKLRGYAEQHQTTVSALIREWVEQMLTVPDRPISLADAVRVLSTLPSQDQQQAA